MENNIKKITAGICSAIMLTSNASAAENMVETAVGAKFEGEIAETFKSALQNNPISSKIFCADPTAVEYQGRLYVYGTSDHQQYLANGPEKDNTYEKTRCCRSDARARFPGPCSGWDVRGIIRAASVSCTCFQGLRQNAQPVR